MNRAAPSRSFVGVVSVDATLEFRNIVSSSLSAGIASRLRLLSLMSVIRILGSSIPGFILSAGVTSPWEREQRETVGRGCKKESEMMQMSCTKDTSIKRGPDKASYGMIPSLCKSLEQCKLYTGRINPLTKFSHRLCS